MTQGKTRRKTRHGMTWHETRQDKTRQDKTTQSTLPTSTYLLLLQNAAAVIFSLGLVFGIVLAKLLGWADHVQDDGMQQYETYTSSYIHVLPGPYIVQQYTAHIIGWMKKKEDPYPYLKSILVLVSSAFAHSISTYYALKWGQLLASHSHSLIYSTRYSYIILHNISLKIPDTRHFKERYYALLILIDANASLSLRCRCK